MSDYFEMMKEVPIAFINMQISEVVQVKEYGPYGPKWNQYRYRAKLGFLKWVKTFNSEAEAVADRNKMLEAIEQCKQLGQK